MTKNELKQLIKECIVEHESLDKWEKLAIKSKEMVKKMKEIAKEEFGV